MMNVTLTDVKEARETIKNIVKRTDLLESVKLSEKQEQMCSINVRIFKKQVLLN